MKKTKFDSAEFMRHAHNMSDIEVCLAFGENFEPLNGLTREQAWEKLPKAEKEFLQHFKELSQVEIAAFFNVTPAAICQSECPRNVDGTYNLTTVFWYRVAKKMESQR